MDSKLQKLIDTYQKYFEYKENRNNYIIGSKIHYGIRNADKLKQLIEYDKVGNFVAIYLKFIINNWLSQCDISLLEVIETPKLLEEAKEIYVVYNCDYIDDIENNLISMIDRCRKDWAGKTKSISEENDSDNVVINLIDNVVESLESLHTTIYFNSNEYIADSLPVCKQFYEFNSIKEAILTINSLEDGIIFSYIHQGISSDGFFAFFIKSNRNLFSIDERISEVYYGQHLNTRNGRYLDKKAWEIFPYELFKFSDYDYKGYARTYSLDNAIETLADIPNKNLDAIIIMLILLKNRYQGNLLEGKSVIVDSLLPINSKLILTDNQNMLMKIENQSIVQKHQEYQMSINWSAEDIIIGNVDDEVVVYKDLPAVKYYSKGFEPNFDEAMYHPYIQSLPESNDVLSIVENEFIATPQHYTKVIFKNVREQLKAYVESQMNKEFKESGGWKYYLNWWSDAISKQLNTIRDKYCVEAFLFNKNTHSAHCRKVKKFDETTTDQFDRIFCMSYDNYQESYVYDYEANELRESGHFYTHDIKDVESNTACNVWFHFKPTDFSDIQTFIGEIEIPKLVRVYQVNVTYSGNPILDITDPCCDITTPFYTQHGSFHSVNYKHTFDFSIGMSQRSLNKKIKQYIEANPERELEIREAWNNRKLEIKKYNEEVKHGY